MPAAGENETEKSPFALLRKNVLDRREHRLPAVIASQTGPAHWIGELPDRVAADSIINRLSNPARTIDLGQIDMRRLRNDHARADQD